MTYLDLKASASGSRDKAQPPSRTGCQGILCLRGAAARGKMIGCDRNWAGPASMNLLPTR